MMLNEIRQNAGLDAVILSEGVKFFKESKKIEKLMDKTRKQLSKVEGDEKKDLEKVVKEFEKVQKLYVDAEKKYKDADSKEEKDAAKREHKMIGRRYEKIMKIVSTQDMKKVLIATGLFVGIGGVIAVGLMMLGGTEGASEILKSTFDKFKEIFKGSSESVKEVKMPNTSDRASGSSGYHERSSRGSGGAGSSFSLPKGVQAEIPEVGRAL